MTPTPRNVPVANLLLDAENPRLPGGYHTQRDTIHAVLRAEGAKTLALAGDVAEHGISPTERLAVIASETERGRFVVLEGNRRVTALRLLAEPSLATGFLASGSQAPSALGECVRRTPHPRDRVR